MCKHLFSGKGGGLLGTILSIGAGFLIPGLGGLLGPALGIGATGADALAGGLLEGGLGLAEGKRGSDLLLQTAEGAIGGGIQGSGVLKDIGSSIDSGLSDVGRSLGLTDGAADTAGTSGISGSSFGGFQNAPNAAPESAISGGGPSSVSGIDSLSSSSLDKVLNNTPELSQTASALNSGSTSGAVSGGADFGGFESGGGYNWNSALNSSPSSSASGGGFLGSSPSFEAGGGIQASTGVSPVDSSFLGSLTKGSNIKDIASIGNLAYKALQGPPELPASLKALQGGLQQTQQQQLSAFNSGTLTAPQQAQIDEQKQAATNALYQQFASMGVADPSKDSRFLSGLQQIEQQSQAQKQTLLQGDFENSTAAGKELDTLGQYQMQQDASFNDEISAASKALFDLLGSD